MNKSDEGKPNLIPPRLSGEAGGLVAAAAGAGLGVRAATDAIAAMKPTTGQRRKTDARRSRFGASIRAAS